MNILVTGAGGFIGGHLCQELQRQGHKVIGIDVKYPEFRDWNSFCDDFHIMDLRYDINSLKTIMRNHKIEQVYALAADMGGMGFISYNDAQILHNNLLINTNTIHAAMEVGLMRYLFTSSACVYPQHLQMDDGVIPLLKESDAYPADPQDAYGWEKLVSEMMCQHYREDYGLDTRIVRFHNTYGPYGTWKGGREKAPAALCRKVAESKLRGDDPISIDVWGDGQAVRSYMYIDDCVTGLMLLMESDYTEPLNLGMRVGVSVDSLALAAYRASEDEKLHIPSFNINHIDGPQGVRNRNSDNSKIIQLFGWEPSISLADGIAKTYKWIEEQVKNEDSF